MDFYIDRRTLLRLLAHLGRPQGQRGRTDPWLRLSAHNGKVYVAANQVVAGAEALVLAEGSCVLPRLLLLKLLQSFRGKPNIHITANAKEVRIERVRLPLFSFAPSNDTAPDTTEPPEAPRRLRERKTRR